jgi:hypothetical protein
MGWYNRRPGEFPELVERIMEHITPMPYEKKKYLLECLEDERFVEVLREMLRSEGKR